MSVADIYYIYPRFWWPHIAFVLPSPGGESRRILRLPPRILQKSFAKSFGCQPPRISESDFEKKRRCAAFITKKMRCRAPKWREKRYSFKERSLQATLSHCSKSKLSPLQKEECSGEISFWKPQQVLGMAYQSRIWCDAHFVK